MFGAKEDCLPQDHPFDKRLDSDDRDVLIDVWRGVLSSENTIDIVPLVELSRIALHSNVQEYVPRLFSEN